MSWIKRLHDSTKLVCNERNNFLSLYLINVGANRRKARIATILVALCATLWPFYSKNISGFASRTLLANVLRAPERASRSRVYFFTRRWIFSLSPPFRRSRLSRYTWSDHYVTFEPPVRSKNYRSRVDREPEGPSFTATSTSITPLSALNLPRPSPRRDHIAVLPELRPETFMSRSSCFRDRITDRTLPAASRPLAISVRASGARPIFQLIHSLRRWRFSKY